ncbi:MAG: TolC family protein [Limnothrix sp. RL_2_0]|nr:TolC family protein [Limnothrix sp. RL_2_0]
MLAFRQILTLSTSSVVIFGFGGLAIAQDIPATPSLQSVALLPNIGVLSQSPAPSIQNVTVGNAVIQPNGLELTERRSPNTLAVLPSEGVITAANLTPKVAEENHSDPAIESVVLPLPIPHVGSLIANKLDVTEIPVAPPKPETSFVFEATMSPENKTQVEQSSTPVLAQNDETVPTIDADVERLPAEVPVEATPPQTTIAPIPTPQITEIPPDLRVNQDLQTLLEPIENDQVIVPSLSEEVSTTEEISLTLEEAINLALERNQTLREAELNLERSQHQRREAIAAKHPTLTNQTSLINSETTGGELAAESAGRDEPFPSTSLNNTIELSYDIYTGGRRSAQIDAADTQIEINELEVMRISKETRLLATTTYYDLQGADSQTAIEESAVDNATQSLRDADLLEKAGLGTKFDVLRAKVELANAEQRLTRAYATQRTVRRRLAQLLSLGPTLDPRTADEISIAGQWGLSLEESILLALQQREELRQQLLLREIDGHQRQIALASIRPQVSVFTNYNLLGVFDDDQSMADGFALGARMQLTLFDGGAAQARARQEDVDQRSPRIVSLINAIKFASP